MEQIREGQTADENIRQMCFTKNGLLVNEFKKIFHDLFDKRGKWYYRIVSILANGPKEFNVICEKIGYKKSGRLSEYLDDLIKAGFVNRDFTWQIKSGKEGNLSQYRLKDNYLRFYLKYIEPNLNKILQNRFAKISMVSFAAWDSIVGLQFENLVLNNREFVHQAIGIKSEEIKIDNPYFQRKTTRQKGCQIDYLIQTKYNTLFVCEIKFSRNVISSKIISEMKNKLEKLVIPKGFSCFPVLIHVNGVNEKVKSSGYFSKIMDFTKLLQNTVD